MSAFSSEAQTASRYLWRAPRLPRPAPATGPAAPTATSRLTHNTTNHHSTFTTHDIVTSPDCEEPTLTFFPHPNCFLTNKWEMAQPSPFDKEILPARKKISKKTHRRWNLWYSVLDAASLADSDTCSQTRWGSTCDPRNTWPQKQGVEGMKLMWKIWPRPHPPPKFFLFLFK